MREFRKKQRKLYLALKILVVISAIALFVFIGIKPIITNINPTLTVVLNYICDFLVIAVLCVLFIYYSKYSKCDSFLTGVENEISDTGYYYTSREEKEISLYSEAVKKDLAQNNFAITTNVEVDGIEFDFRGLKRKEFFYAVEVENLDKNDILAYLDNAISDITVNNLKRRGNGVVCFITDKADDAAIALSKAVTPLGKKEQIKVAICIVELTTGRVYFLGNVKTKCQQMIVNYVMNCDLPINDKFIGKEKLPFQSDLEEQMKSFNLKDFKSGNFYIH